MLVRAEVQPRLMESNSIDPLLSFHSEMLGVVTLTQEPL